MQTVAPVHRDACSDQVPPVESQELSTVLPEWPRVGQIQHYAFLTAGNLPFRLLPSQFIQLHFLPILFQHKSIDWHVAWTGRLTFTCDYIVCISVFSRPSQLTGCYISRISFTHHLSSFILTQFLYKFSHISCPVSVLVVFCPVISSQVSCSVSD